MEVMTASWKEEMRTKWKDVLTRNRPEIARNLDTEGELINYLESTGIFNKRACKGFQSQKGKYAQASDILEALLKRPFEDFIKFCQVLEQIRQGHIVRDYLVSLDPISRPSTTPTLQSDSVPTGLLNQLEDSILREQWKDLIRNNYPALIDRIDPDNGLWNILVSKRIIVEWLLDTFKMKKGRGNRVAALLDHLILKRPYEDFVQFCEALKESSQSDIVTKYLTPGNLNDDRSDCEPVISSPSRSEGEIPMVVRGWKQILVDRRNSLVEKLNCEDGLLNELASSKVMNTMSYDCCKEEPNSIAQAEYLIDHLRKRSDRDFAYFCVALEKTNQKHIIDEFFGPAERTIVSEQASDEINELNIRDHLLLTSKNENLRNGVTQTGQSNEPSGNFPGEVGRIYQPADETPGETTHPGILRQSSGDILRRELDVDLRNPEINLNAGPSTRCQEDRIVAEIAVNQNVEIANNTVAQVCRSEEPGGPTEIYEISVHNSNLQFYNEHFRTAYPMSKPCRGRCIIFNVINVRGMPPRNGTVQDGLLIIELFKKLHFEVLEIKDPKSQEITQKLIEVSQDATLQNDECLAIFVLSHGNIRSINNKHVECIFGSDGKPVSTDDILEPFIDRNCSFLKDKPRLVFFQACRGNYYDGTDSEPMEGEVSSESTEELAGSRTVTDAPEPPSYKDFFIAYPTQSEFRSFRNQQLGSWYVNAIVRVFQEHVHNTGLCNMMNIVNGKMSSWVSNTTDSRSDRKKQVAMYKSNFTKADLYFFPGITTGMISSLG